MNRVKAFIERGSDGTYSVYVDLDDNTLNYGIHGNGKTVKEAADFNSAYEAMKEFHKQKGKPFVEAEFDFKHDTASFLEYYNKIISLAGLERLTGVNQGLLSHYVNGLKKPNKRTKEKIQVKLHEFADELKHLELV